MKKRKMEKRNLQNEVDDSADRTKPAAECYKDDRGMMCMVKTTNSK